MHYAGEYVFGTHESETRDSQTPVSRLCPQELLRLQMTQLSMWIPSWKRVRGNQQLQECSTLLKMKQAGTTMDSHLLHLCNLEVRMPLKKSNNSLNPACFASQLRKSTQRKCLIPGLPTIEEKV